MRYDTLGILCHLKVLTTDPKKLKAVWERSTQQHIPEENNLQSVIGPTNF
jgi:uncharacterized protein YqfB (UPF0267 family)